MGFILGLYGFRVYMGFYLGLYPCLRNVRRGGPYVISVYTKKWFTHDRDSQVQDLR